MPPSRSLPRLQIAFAALLFSTGGAAIKACSLDAWQVACLRSAIAAAAILLFIPASRRGYRPATFVYGAIFAATLVLFVTATKLTTSANAIYLQSTAPLYVMLVAPFALRERLRRSDLAVAALFTAGLVLFFAIDEPARATAPDPRRGNWLAALSGATFALTVVGLRKETQRGTDSSLAVVVAGNLIAAVCCAPLAFPIEQSSPVDWAVLGYLGAFQIGLAYLCMTLGLRHVPAFEGSLLLMIEPALNPVWTYWLHGERPASLALLGGAAILVASIVKSWLGARATSPSDPA